VCVCVYIYIYIYFIRLTCIRVYVHKDIFVLLYGSENSITHLLGELIFRDVSRKRFAIIINEHIVAEQGLYIPGKLLPHSVYVHILKFEFHKIQKTDIQHYSSVFFIRNWKQLPQLFSCT